jgi:hypothetical protein
MALAKSGGMRWGIVFLFLVLGTWLGIFLQRFSASASLFSNVIDFVIDVKQIDLIMIRFGFYFALKMNLGTLIGAVAGIVASR